MEGFSLTGHGKASLIEVDIPTRSGGHHPDYDEEGDFFSVFGDAFNGISVSGPFATHESAQLYCEEARSNHEEWHVMENVRALTNALALPIAEFRPPCADLSRKVAPGTSGYAMEVGK